MNLSRLPRLLPLMLFIGLLAASLSLPASAHARRAATPTEARAAGALLIRDMPASIRPCVRGWKGYINTVAPAGRYAYLWPIMRTTGGCYPINGGSFARRPRATGGGWVSLHQSASGGDSCADLKLPASVYRDLTRSRCY